MDARMKDLLAKRAADDARIWKRPDDVAAGTAAAAAAAAAAGTIANVPNRDQTPLLKH